MIQIARRRPAERSAFGSRYATLLIFFLTWVACSPWVAVAAESDPPDLHIAPYLQNVKPDGITVMWETTEPVAGAVEFGSDGKFDRTIEEPEARKIHEIHLTGLKPATTYSYRARYGDRLLPAAAFTTAPSPGTPNWRFVVYGDSRSNPDTHERNVRQIMKLKPGIILNTGDLVARGSQYEQWKPQYFDPLRGVSKYVPIYPCLGNHEQNAIHYYNYHSLPDEEGEVYYSFDYANAHILSLNSNADDAPFELGERQTEWLIDDLKTHQDATWKIVYFHHPLFRSHPTRGITEQRWVWQPLFDELGVDLVINGHDHYYMRAYPVGNYTGKPRRGVVHLISGGGGANTYPMVPKTHAAFRRRIHHVTAIDVMGDRLVGRAIDIDGNTFDAFVVDKQAVNSPEEFVSYEIFELERDLGRAIRETPVIEADEQGARVDTVLRVPNPFQVPVAATFRWNGTNGWRVDPEERHMLLKPGKPLELPIRAEGTAERLYPVPAAVLEFRTPEGEKAFRNDRIEFSALKVWQRRTVEATAAKEPPVVDGELDDGAWQGVANVGALVDVQGDRAPERRTVVRLIHHDGTLYAAAMVSSPAGLTEQGYEGRDNRRLFRDDHVRLHIAVGERVYQFAVNASGALLDAQGEDREWNSGAQAATAAHPRGWQAELAIPLKDLGADTAPLKINIIRRDQTANRESEFSLTFGVSNLDHLVPMYQSDLAAVDRYAELVLR